MNLYLCSPFVDLVTTLVTSILVIKSGHIKIMLKHMTPVLSNPTNYRFLMKVLMKVPTMKTMFNTVVRHPTCRPNRTNIRQDL